MKCERNKNVKTMELIHKNIFVGSLLFSIFALIYKKEFACVTKRV